MRSCRCFEFSSATTSLEHASKCLFDNQGSKLCKGAVGAYLGLLSGLRRPPDLGYQYRRISPEKVANRTWKTQLFYSSSHLGRFCQQNHQFGNFSLALCKLRIDYFPGRMIFSKYSIGRAPWLSAVL